MWCQPHTSVNTISLVFNIPWLSAVLCVRLKVLGLSIVYLCMSTLIAIVSYYIHIFNKINRKRGNKCEREQERVYKRVRREKRRKKWFNCVINLKKLKKYSLRKEWNLALEQQGNQEQATTFLPTMVTCLYYIFAAIVI